jgi:transposase
MGFSLALVCPLTIKKSIGLQRGKNDRIDAKRIANYAVLHYRKLKLYKLPDKELVKLRGGIGVINTIVFDNFQRFDNPRKFACYCGVPHLNILQVFLYEEKHRHLHYLTKK